KRANLALELDACQELTVRNDEEVPFLLRPVTGKGVYNTPPFLAAAGFQPAAWHKAPPCGSQTSSDGAQLRRARRPGTPGCPRHPQGSRPTKRNRRRCRAPTLSVLAIR